MEAAGMAFVHGLGGRIGASGGGFERRWGPPASRSCRRVVTLSVGRKYVFSEGLEEQTRRKDALEIVSVDTEVARILELIDSDEREQAMQKYRDMRAANLVPTTYTFNKLISALGRNNHMADADYVFEDMQSCGGSPDFITLSLLLSKYSELRDIDNMERTYQRMKDLEITPSTITFKLMMEAYFSVEDFSAAERVYRETNRFHIEPDIHLFLKIMRLQNRVDQPEAAIETYATLRQRKIQPNYEIYLALIESYTKLGRFRKAIDLLKVMKKKGTKPDEMPFSVVSRELARQGDAQGLDNLFRMIRRFRFATPTALTYNHLIEAHGKGRGIEAAEEKLEMMLEEGVDPNANTLNVMVRLYDEYDEIGNIEAICGRFEKAGVRPDLECSKELVRIYAERLDVAAAEARLAATHESELAVQDEAYAAMIRMYARTGQIDVAGQSFDRWRVAGFAVGARAYREMLVGYNAHGRTGEVMELLQNMRDSRLRVSTEVYAAAMCAMMKDGLEAEVFDMFTTMRERGSRPTGWLYEAVVQVLCEGDALTRAKRTVVEMERNGIVAGARTFAHFVTAFVRRSEPDKVVDTLQQMERREIDINDDIVRTLADATRKDPEVFKPALQRAARMMKNRRPGAGRREEPEARAIADSTDVSEAYSFLIAAATSACRRRSPLQARGVAAEPSGNAAAQQSHK